MSGGAHAKMKQVWLVCQRCGSAGTIWRRRSKLKEPEHIKHLWCFKCQERTPHMEVREEEL